MHSGALIRGHEWGTDSNTVIPMAGAVGTVQGPPPWTRHSTPTVGQDLLGLLLPASKGKGAPSWPLV